MKKYINTSNYYLSSLALAIPAEDIAGTIEVVDIMCDWVTLPTEWYYWIDVDFNNVDKREIFRIVARDWYTLTYDKRISPNGACAHSIWAPVWLRDFSELLNSLSKNTDNFWEVEIWSWLKVKVYWWNIVSPGREYKSIWDTILNLPSNSKVYIEYVFPSNEFIITNEINKENYLLAEVTTWQNMVYSLTDMRSVLVDWWGIWDMLKEIYDPTNKNADAFFIDNMYDTEDWEKKVVSKSEANTWSAKQDFLVNGTNLKTINWHSILMNDWTWDDNLIIAPSLWFDFAYEVSQYWISSHQLSASNTPVSTSSFMVFVNSGTWMFPTTDYTYNNGTRTITLVNQLWENERLIIWIIKKSWTTIDPDDIGRWIISIIKNWVVVDTFNVNQTADKNIDIGTVWNWTLSISNNWTPVITFSANQTTNWTLELTDYIKNWNLTLKQWTTTVWTFSANSASNSTVQFKDLILVTQAQYDALGPEKTSDGNFYLLYS